MPYPRDPSLFPFLKKIVDFLCVSNIDIYCVTDDDKHFIVSSIFLFPSLIRVRKNARLVLKNGFMY